MKRALIFTGILCHLGATVSGQGITQSSINRFDATSEGWRIGAAGVQPAWNSGTSYNGQPGFLGHFSDAGGANGKWLMWSDQAQWRGDYVTAGVSGIGLWVDNRAGSSLALRVAFDGPGGWFYSTAQTVINATGGDDWVRLLYSLDAGNFTYAGGSGGSGQFADTIRGVSRFEILGGSAGVTYNGGGDIIDAGTSVNTLWLDNIAAVPEPSSLTLLVGATAVLIVRRRLT
jgi:hypothetical protein